MVQEAIVTNSFSNGFAEVAVTRTTVCGGNCGNCESCKYQNEIKIIAKNNVNAQRGQSVLIETRSSFVFGAAILVYLLPIVLFVIGYSAAAALAALEGICVLASFLTLIISAAVIIFVHRKKKGTITYDIIKISNGAENL